MPRMKSAKGSQLRILPLISTLPNSDLVMMAILLTIRTQQVACAMACSVFLNANFVGVHSGLDVVIHSSRVAFGSSLARVEHPIYSWYIGEKNLPNVGSKEQAEENYR
jgi:hypothetical protein